MPRIVSAVGQDALGKAAKADIRALGLDTTFLQRYDRLPTGTASVRLGPGDRTDAVTISDDMLARIEKWSSRIRRAPSWLESVRPTTAGHASSVQGPT